MSDHIENPRERYSHPDKLIEDKDLDDKSKLRLLHSWKEDVEARLRTESEGMSKNDPMKADHASSLAGEQSMLNKAINRLQE